jgi:hypothetical protein
LFLGMPPPFKEMRREFNRGRLAVPHRGRVLPKCPFGSSRSAWSGSGSSRRTSGWPDASFARCLRQTATIECAARNDGRIPSCADRVAAPGGYGMDLRTGQFRSIYLVGRLELSANRLHATCLGCLRQARRTSHPPTTSDLLEWRSRNAQSRPPRLKWGTPFRMRAPL